MVLAFHFTALIYTCTAMHCNIIALHCNIIALHCNIITLQCIVVVLHSITLYYIVGRIVSVVYSVYVHFVVCTSYKILTMADIRGRGGKENADIG